MDLGSWDAIWRWTWPAVLLLVWSVAVLWASQRFFAWFGRRTVATDPRVDERFVLRLRRLTTFGSLVAGGYVWAGLAPLPRWVHLALAEDVEPWFWYSLGLILWIDLGAYITRRVTGAIARKADRTRTDLDDALAAAVRRPLYLGILISGINLWAAMVPLPSAATPWFVLGTKAGLVLLAVLFVDTFVQTWTRLREAASPVLRTSGTVLRAAARAIIYILGFLVIAATVDIDITPIITTLGVGSLAIGLALQKTLEDFIAGLLIAADQPIRVGDFVQLEGGEAGWVLSIGWRTVRMRTRDDQFVVVPNSRLAQATVTNRSMPTHEISFTVRVGVHYRTDLDHARDVTLEVARHLQAADARAVASFEPRLVYSVFGDSAIEFLVWLRAVTWEEHFGLKDAFIRSLHRAFEREGIVIPFPIRTLDIPEGTILTARLEPPATVVPPA